MVAQSPVFLKALSGFTLLDPETGKTLCDFQGDRNFTPASNIKILTLATCLAVLRDSVPGMQVVDMENAAVYRGTGDPTFLNPLFQSWQGIFQHIRHDTLRQRFVVGRALKDQPLGPGWAWDDATESYSAERSDLPIYGGLITVHNDTARARRRVEPLFFQSMFVDKEELTRVPAGLVSNQFYQWPEKPKIETLHLPIINASSLSRFLLADTLRANYQPLENTSIPMGFEQVTQWRTLYSTPIDTVLRRMMYQSDNFIAEQMLLACAGEKFGALQQDTVMEWMLDSCVSNLTQRPRWVDGSGLSRYNLLSPRSIAQVLSALWHEQPRDRLFSLFPAGGQSGTIEGWYAGKDGKPYVFAKTGSMSGVCCLSGYVVCKSGKVLVFSFMHNHFIGSSRPWRAEMQRVLEQIHAKF